MNRSTILSLIVSVLSVSGVFADKTPPQKETYVVWGYSHKGAECVGRFEDFITAQRLAQQARANSQRRFDAVEIEVGQRDSGSVMVFEVWRNPCKGYYKCGSFKTEWEASLAADAARKQGDEVEVVVRWR